MTSLDVVAAGFTLTHDQFAQIVVPVGSSGVLLGRGVWGSAAGRDVMLDVFRPQSTEISSFLKVDLSTVVVRRMQRCGAAVLIASVEPGWEALLRLSRHDPLPVTTGATTDQRTAGSFARPLVEVAAAQPLIGARDDTAREWTTSMTMLPSADLRSTTHARESDVTLLGRTAPESAAVIGAVLGLQAAEVDVLQALPWDHVMVVSGRRCTVVHLRLTAEELRLRAAASGWQRARPRGKGAQSRTTPTL